VQEKKIKAEIAYMVEACSSEGLWIPADDWEGVFSAAAFSLLFFWILLLSVLNRKQTMRVNNNALGKTLV
jgi:hypothetical protein